MTTLTQARDGLEARLKTIAGLRVHDHVPEDINPPAAVILPPIIPDYREALAGGSVTVTFPVLLLAAATFARQQLELYELLERTGPRSVFAVIEADHTLGGLNVNALVVSAEDFDTSRFGLTNYYARALNVLVFVGG